MELDDPIEEMINLAREMYQQDIISEATFNSLMERIKIDRAKINQMEKFSNEGEITPSEKAD